MTTVESPRTYIGQKESPVTGERLSDERIISLLAALGTHEAKALTLLMFADGNTYSQSSLHRRLTTLAAASRWPISIDMPLYYCRSFLEPLDLVAIAPDSRGRVITELGKEQGIPLAGLLLSFSLEHEIDLSSLLGKTGSTYTYKRSSVQTRLAILRNLAGDNPPTFTVDLARLVGTSRMITGSHLRELTRNGIINYRTREPDEDYAYFRLTKTGQFHRQNFDHNHQSAISLTPKQRGFIREFIFIIDGFQDMNPQLLSLGQKLGRQIIANPQLVTVLLDKAREASPGVNEAPQEKTIKLILEVIQNFSGNNRAVTSKQIRDILEESYQCRLGISRIRQLLNQLLVNGQITSIKKSRQRYFALANQPTSS